MDSWHRIADRCDPQRGTPQIAGGVLNNQKTDGRLQLFRRRAISHGVISDLSDRPLWKWSVRLEIEGVIQAFIEFVARIAVDEFAAILHFVPVIASGGSGLGAARRFQRLDSLRGSLAGTGGIFEILAYLRALLVERDLIVAGLWRIFGILQLAATEVVDKALPEVIDSIHAPAGDRIDAERRATVDGCLTVVEAFTDLVTDLVFIGRFFTDRCTDEILADQSIAAVVVVVIAVLAFGSLKGVFRWLTGYETEGDGGTQQCDCRDNGWRIVVERSRSHIVVLIRR